MARILIVEDEQTLLSALQYGLEKEGYSVISVEDGSAALAKVHEQPPDLIILDLLLPGMHGLDVCRAIRRESNVPIIILTARTDEIDRVVGLEVGADDYVTKPFSMKELFARIRAHMRRTGPPADGDHHEILSHGDLAIDVTRHEVLQAGEIVALKPKELALLIFLIRNRGQAFSRDQLLEHVWGYEAFGQTRTVDVHVSELRRKLKDDPKSPSSILTVRGIGYRFSR